ncbi:LIC_12708 family protein [Treponema zioleckii]|uniref:LIC_12708 family protein n=1 Tax=Treponema zioleckii TaxID=331680 RepID=UPI00168B243E|nr:hypothetical protein [Treponema zioleckii]
MRFKSGILLIFCIASLALVGCARSGVVATLNENELFNLNYGSFEDELNLFDLSKHEQVNTYMTMRDGFFYIANGEAKKILEFNSYGDLLTVIYNEDSNIMPPAFKPDSNKVSMKKSVSYPFNTLGPIVVDSRKYIYVVDTLTPEMQERFVQSEGKNSETGNDKKDLLLSSVVLRFDSDGNFIDYVGQDGPGGTPFPFIKNIYTNSRNELIVIGASGGDGYAVYWFNTSGFPLYNIQISNSSIPVPKKDVEQNLVKYLSIENLVPDYTAMKLYLKVDCYGTSIDPNLKIATGVEFKKTMLYPFVVRSGTFEEPLEIPVYQYTVSEDMAKSVYNIPYDFFGVSKNGWLFFMVPTENGYLTQMVQPDGQKIVKRSLDVNHEKNLYFNLSLSDEGIISGLFVQKEKAKISWWRTDALLDAYLGE